MIDIIVTIFLTIGLFFILTGAIGLLRFPDVYSRIHATGLASTLGIGSVLIASLIYFSFNTHVFSVKELLVLGFLLLTAPVATHMIGQAAYRTGVSLWQKNVLDELKKDEEADAGS
ncbi:monovalent cation/H(+) antiporter subunit G [Chloroflexota bacterium]